MDENDPEFTGGTAQQKRSPHLLLFGLASLKKMLIIDLKLLLCSFDNLFRHQITHGQRRQVGIKTDPLLQFAQR